MDFEKLLVELVRGIGQDCYVDLPDTAARPVSRITLLGGPVATSANPVWLDRATVQVDVWADTKAEAWTLTDQIRTALLEAPRTQPLTVVVSFAAAEHPAYLPDQDWLVDGKPGPRYSMTVRLSAHP